MERRGGHHGLFRDARLIGAWMVAVVLGMGILARHEFTPAPAAHAATIWPIQTGLTQTSDCPTLLLFAHPECPCTTASMEELAQLVTRVGTSMNAHVIVYSWPQQPRDVTQTTAWMAASILPGVVLHKDPDGALARQFGVTTSGHALLYDPAGRLIFSGGITGSRAHAGDNAGLRAVIAMIENGSTNSPTVATTDVFGCAILPETR